MISYYLLCLIDFLLISYNTLIIISLNYKKRRMYLYILFEMHRIEAENSFNELFYFDIKLCMAVKTYFYMK